MKGDWIDRRSPAQARALLLALLALGAALAAVAIGIEEPARRAGPSDLDIYAHVVAALRAGEAYYPALHEALLAGGYGTLSPLNWRTPGFLTFLSWFPNLALAQAALAGLTLFGWGMGTAYAWRLGGTATAIGAALALGLGLLAIAAPRAELSFELCAGALILISVAAYGLGWRLLGFVAGGLALVVRELALIYVLVCLGLALREKRWGEAAMWLLALLAYGLFYFWHAQQAMGLLGPGDHAAPAGWLQFGGAEFVLRTAAFNGVLLLAPYWVAALALVLGLAGLKSLARPALATGLYLLLFLFYGRPENAYWGALYTPLLTLGLVLAPQAIAALFVRSRRSS